MSGHSKWATTHRQKAITDAKRSAVFTKLSRLITVAAKEKGGDLNSNFSLRMLVEKARESSMPKENIEKAIKKGTGELEGEIYEELTYEAMGPFNTQFIVKCLTSNKNRTANDVRLIFSKHNGSFSSVLWNFEQKGVIQLNIENLELKIKEFGIQREDFDLELIDNGADDVKIEDGKIFIYSDVKELQKIKEYLDSKNIIVESADIEYLAKDKLELDDEQSEKIENMINMLDENEDVVSWWCNF